MPPAEADATEAVIRGVNPAAAIHRTIRGEIDLGLLMGVDAYAARQLLAGSRKAKTSAPCSDGHGHDHDHGDHDHAHDHAKAPTHYELRGISSLQVELPTLTSAQLDKLDEWIRNVLWEKQLPNRPTAESGALDVLRCKGIFVTDDGGVHVLQGVRNLYEIARVEKEDEELGLPDTGKLVLIGKGLSEDVRRSLVEHLEIA